VVFEGEIEMLAVPLHDPDMVIVFEIFEDSHAFFALWSGKEIVAGGVAAAGVVAVDPEPLLRQPDSEKAEIKMTAKYFFI
jgi:hypothetical protein